MNQGLWEFHMQWERPRYSRKVVRRAGKLLAFEDPVPFHIDVDGHIERAADLFRELNAQVVFNNWRSAHAYPLNTFKVTLRDRARRVDQEALTAQRLKRSPSIIAKLRRFENMDLARMQDIGGCRAIVRDIPAVYQLWHAFDTGRHRHILDDFKDYIEEPKEDGYRGIHLIYKYVGRGNGSVYNGLRIEVQLRTQIQHAWATAVETVDLFTRQAIKAGQGQVQWREFFCVASEAFSVLEHSEPMPMEERSRIKALLVDLSSQLDVFNRLHRYSEAVQLVEQIKEASQYLLELDLVNDELRVRGFTAKERDKAQKEYTEAEKRLGENGDVVLVSVENVNALRKAFPNYFADTTLFIATLDEVLAWESDEVNNLLIEWLSKRPEE
ncbi:(p)ppGpp synthetase [Dyella terrae]|uniref:(P)ppGpp synthetase n=3 Tax=Dyella TaxID=231454 RepID=A0A4R0YZE6_9GAMM|nr:RelA/SpoT domain-containing protein [Dyella soli]TBR39619.1 (p)ppGpp synthetase [Dyella terrae]TCI12799.1 (p)ppGpp synthetase [Dyella soli]